MDDVLSAHNVPFDTWLGRHPFHGLFSRTVWVNWRQKGLTILHFNETTDDGVTVTSADHMRLFTRRCRQITMPACHHSIFTGWMLFLMPNQQCQKTEGIYSTLLIGRILSDSTRGRTRLKV